jgi:phosphoglycerol transferase MdoB-like AlkP superfamily enzyme
MTSHAGFARFKPLYLLAGCYVAIGAVLRLVLWRAFGIEQHVSAATFAWLLPAGAAADAAEALYLLAPFAVFLWLLPDRVHGKRITRAIMLAGSFLWLFGLLFVAAIEYYFFEEFDARLNLVAVDYLMYPTEVVGDIWVAYPVVTAALALAACAAAAVYALARHLHAADSSSTFAKRTLAVLPLVALLILAATGFETHALARSTNRVANEIAANGASSFFRALRTNEIDYHAYYASRESAQNLRDLATQLGDGGGTFTRLGEGRLDRTFPANPAGLGRLNVVVIASESFGAEFSHLYGSERDWTPQFDALANDGVWFSHMYASGTRTVRGLEAIATSLPPIPSVSVLRRPGNEGIANWGTVMRRQGYRASFLYGGYGYFDNMNYFFGHNGFEVRDRTQITRPLRFENIWGVADEDLFDSALDYYDEVARTGKPFFSIVMTTSNHKPFTFRDGVPGVKPEGGGREAGVRYADFAQGYFLREARRHAWFDDTLFIIVADHGARVYGREEIPLKTYEIPMLFYSPKHLRPGRIDTLTTQIDIAPTVLGLLGLPYSAPFFGEDVMHVPAENRVALFSHNHDVALYRNGELAILGLGKSVDDVRYDRRTDSYRRAVANPQLNNLAMAYYQTAFELFRDRRYK